MKINTQNARLAVSAGLANQFPSAAIPQVAFSGRSNVGKSSLVNALLSRKSLARVSGTPGKTITVNFYDVDSKMFLVDLPGYGYARRTYEEQKKWSALTDGYFTNNKNIDLLKLVIQLVDSRVGITDNDAEMIGFLKDMRLPYIVVATKVDKLNATERKNNIAKIEAEAGTLVIPFSSQSGEGKENLWNEIFRHVQNQ